MDKKIFEGQYEWCIECGEAWPIYSPAFNKCHECATEEELREGFRCLYESKEYVQWALDKFRSWVEEYNKEDEPFDRDATADELIERIYKAIGRVQKGLVQSKPSYH
jgi:hypothetical protein